ncbi:hypothetical protein Hypma_000040 [Hypsizygus marmoreus]|uniref:Uncharacterized protein n=1 Tax=Hypsizygus marmoreus TaxID=39966 RepID=A0A369K951_HYPMA|nr:hypothetical protein Hypma_000040 [Hypsizygus marmoreus]
MLKLWRSSSCVLYSSHSRLKLSALLGVRRWQRRFNSSDSVESIKSAITTYPKVYPSRCEISTLDPSRLQDSDFLDLSNGVSCTRLVTSTPIILHPSASSSPPEWCHSNIQIYYHGKIGLRRPFPAHARGFLYYHRDPELPPTSGAVRFSLTPDAHASSFSAGMDLILPDGRTPWAIWLVTIANAAKYVGLKHLLLSDGLVTPELLEHCRHLGVGSEASNGLNQMYRHTLFRLDQPFVLDLASTPRFSVVGPQGMERAVITFTRVQMRHTKKPFFPFSGQCMVRFERSLAPEHAGKRVAVIRVLEILTPIVSTNPTYTPGHKGGLFRIPTMCTSLDVIWFSLLIRKGQVVVGPLPHERLSVGRPNDIAIMGKMSSGSLHLHAERLASLAEVGRRWPWHAVAGAQPPETRYMSLLSADVRGVALESLPYSNGRRVRKSSLQTSFFQFG